MKFKKMAILKSLAFVLTTSIFTLALIVPPLNKTNNDAQSINYGQATPTTNLPSYDNNITTSHIADSVQNEPIVLSNNNVISLVEGQNNYLYLKKLNSDGSVNESFKLRHFDGTEFIFNDGYVINTYFVYNNYLYIAYSDYLSNYINLQAFYLADGIEDPKQSRTIVISNSEGTANVNQKVIRQNPSNPGQIFISEYINNVEYMVMYNIYDYNFTDLISTSNMVDISRLAISLPEKNLLISPLIYNNQMVAVVEDKNKTSNGINFLTYYINDNGKLALKSSLINAYPKNWNTSDLNNLNYADFKSVIIPSNGSTYYAILYIKDKFDGTNWNQQGKGTAIILKLDANNYSVLDKNNIDFINNRTANGQVNVFYDTMKIDNKVEPVVVFDTPSSATKTNFSIVLGDPTSKYYNLDDVMQNKKPGANLYFKSNSIDAKYIHSNFVQIDSNNNIIYSSFKTSGTKLPIESTKVLNKTIKNDSHQLSYNVINQSSVVNDLKPTIKMTNYSGNAITSQPNGLPSYDPLLLTKFGLDYYDPSDASTVDVSTIIPQNVTSVDILTYCKNIFGDTRISPSSTTHNDYYNKLNGGVQNKDYQYVYYTNDNSGTINVAINFYASSHTSSSWFWDYGGQTYDIVLHGFKQKINNAADIIHVMGATEKSSTTIETWTKKTNISKILSKTNSEVITYLNDNLNQFFDYIDTYLPNNKDKREPLNQIIQITYISNITNSGTISFVYKDFSQNIQTGLPNSTNLDKIITISGFLPPVKTMPVWEIVVITLVSVIGLILICSGAYMFNKRVLQAQKVVKEKQTRRDERIYLQENTANGGKRSNKATVKNKKIFDDKITNYKKKDLKHLQEKFEDSIFDGAKVKGKETQIEKEERLNVRAKEKARMKNILDRQNNSYEEARASGSDITWDSKTTGEEQADQLKRMQEDDVLRTTIKDKSKGSYVVNKIVLDEENQKDYLYKTSKQDVKLKNEKEENLTKASLKQELAELERMEVEDFDDDLNPIVSTSNTQKLNKNDHDEKKIIKPKKSPQSKPTFRDLDNLDIEEMTEEELIEFERRLDGMDN